jgi:predicted transcriptional regulator
VRSIVSSSSTPTRHFVSGRSSTPSIVDTVDVPERSVGPTLKRLEEHDLVEHRDRF